MPASEARFGGHRVIKTNREPRAPAPVHRVLRRETAQAAASTAVIARHASESGFPFAHCKGCPWQAGARSVNEGAMLKATKLQQLSDEELMGLVAANCDHEAFAELFRRYERRVFWCVLRRLGDWQWAEDVTAETFVKLFVRRRRWRADGRPFMQLLFALARYEAIRRFQKRRRSVMACDCDDVAQVQWQDPDDARAEEERAYVLQMAIRRLPPKQADAVRAVCIEGQTSHQHGKSVGRTYASVNSSIYSGMRNLQADKALAALV